MMIGTTHGKGGLAGAARMALAALTLVLVPPAHALEGGELESRRADTMRALEALGREIVVSEERIASIATEIAELRRDNATLSAALIQAAKTERKLTQDIADSVARLGELAGSESVLRESLAERRGLLAEVLAALQRMGLNPPPAILVSPEDALSSVRSSILLGAVVPELREETLALIADLTELRRIMTSIASERETLQATAAEQVAERQRLSILLDEKRALQSRSEETLVAERERAALLADRSGSLRELIDALEADIETARETARLEAEKARQEALERAETAAAAPSAGRLAGLPGAVPFAALHGQVGLPVAGQIRRRFGERDTEGATVLGDMVATHSGAIVTAPTDGSVLYAGPFRSYGQLLILDAGNGYHIVLAGMGRISVVPGQAVLAGEPVGVMGEARVASAMAFGDGNAGPELYVEFRREGKPVDPAPWWAERYSGRTENDT